MEMSVWKILPNHAHVCNAQLMEKASGISPVQMAAILRQTQLSDDPEHVLSSDQFQKIFRFLDGLSANAVVAGPADPVQSAVQSPVEKVVAKASELPAAVLTEAAAPAPAPKPIISVLSPRRYRKITVEELIAAGGDPDVLEDVFSEYVDDSLDDVDEDILEHLLASGFLVVATENDQHRRDGSENSAPGAVKREVAVKDQPSESTAPADDCPCDVCGICGHSSSRCQLAVQRKRGLELNFIQIGRLGKEKIIDIRSACRKSGRLSKDISPQEARNIENAFNKLLGGNERR